MKDVKHTPTPWRATETAEVLAVAGGHICVCGDADEHGNPVDQANAEFIARACNSHEALLDACKAILGGIQSEAIVSGVPRVGMAHCIPGPDYFNEHINRLKTAIAKAEGGAA